MTVERRPCVFDLARLLTIIAGSAEADVSACLHTMIMSMMLARQSSDVHLALIDVKDTMGLSIYGGAHHLHGGKIVRSISAANERLVALCSDLKARSAQATRESISRPRTVVVISEISDLLLADNPLDTLVTLLQRLARDSDVHLIVATQQPEHVILPKVLRALPSRIALKLATEANSQIVLESIGAERLLTEGDMFVRLGATRLYECRR